MKISDKASRNMWIISGFIWLMMFLKGFGEEGLSVSTIFRGIFGITCFFSAYSTHKRITKDN